MTGGGTFASGTGAATLDGAATIATDLAFTVASGTGAVSLNGVNALHGDNNIAGGQDLHMTGAGTFASGSGAVTLNTDVAIAMGKDLHMHGAGTFASGTGAVTLIVRKLSPMTRISERRIRQHRHCKDLHCFRPIWCGDFLHEHRCSDALRRLRHCFRVVPVACALLQSGCVDSEIHETTFSGEYSRGMRIAAEWLL